MVEIIEEKWGLVIKYGHNLEERVRDLRKLNADFPEHPKFYDQSQICTTREQSQRLLSLGLKKETADVSIICKYVGCDDDGVLIYEENIYTYPPSNEKICPAWSLHRLIELIDEPEHIARWIGVQIANYYDYTVDCIEWLIKERYFNKEYLV